MHTRPSAGGATEAIPFFTMEFHQGETLGSRIRREGRISGGPARVLARQMCAGLAAIHRAGIVHRDFKSDNVFLVHRSVGHEEALLMDFGLARARERPPSSAGVIVGTFEYLAPEQLAGDAPTPAADIYALGVVMFEMLTGQRPDRAPLSPWEGRSTGAHDDPKGSFGGDRLDALWGPIIKRCLERDPSLRWTSAVALDEALS